MTLAQLYERHFGHIYLRCRRMVHNPAIAEELAQEVFVQAATSLARFVPLVDHKPWLNRIATNICLNYLQKASTRREFALGDEVLGLHTPVVDGEELTSRLDLERFAAGLPDEERAVFLGKFVEGLSNEELAAQCKCTMRTIINRAHRATELFAEWFHGL